MPRELRAFGAEAFDARAAARIAIPVLLLVGEHSPDAVRADPETVAAALPDVRVRVLEGQLHVAHLTDPKGIAEQVLSFLAE